MLQEFLNNSLLPIKEEDNLDKLKKSSTVLVKRLKKKKSRIPSFTLTALDPEISPDNQNVEEVRKIITGKWRTFQNNSKDKPITFIRAVILEALESVSKEEELANIIWLSGRNIQKHLKLVDKEKELIATFLLGLGNKLEKYSAHKWGLFSESRKQNSKYEIEKLGGLRINKKELENHLRAASLQSSLDGGENPQYPSNNSAQWPNFFSERASKGFAEVINKTLKTVSLNQNKIEESIYQLLTQIEEECAEIIQIRSQLLWWKESCYSSSFDQSYRKLDSGLLKIVLAYDYSSFVPPIYPTCVDYFLKETYRSLSEEESKKVKISEFLKQVESSNIQLQTLFIEPKEEVGRISLLNFIQGLVWEKYSLRQFKKLVGFPSNTEMTSPEFILWIFHDLQVQKINSTK